MATQHAAQRHTPHDEDPAYAEHSHHPNYVRVYLILLALLVVSILGPELEIRAVTLVTAFGIALVKAYMVAKNFMHVNVAPRYIVYLCTTCIVFMLLFFAGVAPDVMKSSGTRWEKPSWVQAHLDHEAGKGAGHGDAHGGGH